MEKLRFKKIENRIRSEEIIDQKSYAFIRELNSYSEEQLNKAAIIDENRTYTYRQMFRQWENYAEVFSALGMTGKNHTRVLLMPGIGAESLFSFFALNMTGASVSFAPLSMFLANKDTGSLEKVLADEKITDLVISDSSLLPELPYPMVIRAIRLIQQKKKDLGIRHIIVLHVPVTDSFAPCVLAWENRFFYEYLKEIPDIMLMDELLEKYQAYPIAYCDPDSSESSVIIHTSGTTSGVPKPIALSDAALNEAVRRFLVLEDMQHFRGTAVTVPPIEPVAGYLMIDMIYLPLAFGGTVVLIPQGAASPLYLEAIGHYRTNILFTEYRMLEAWRNLPPCMRPDLSNIKLLAFGGSHMSADTRKKCNAIIRKMGCPVRITIGYGLSEAGGACLISRDDTEDDTIGYTLPGVSAKIRDEEDGRFYTPEDGPRIGGLYLSTKALSSGRIDDTVIFETEDIDGVPYLATHDLVEVNEDGSMTCLGRTNQFFVNEDGKRFESGLVENAFASRPGIKACAIVPTMFKKTHDTIPVLYAAADASSSDAVQTVKEALSDLFGQSEVDSSVRLLEHIVITDALPYNSAGKIDTIGLRRGNVKGDWYRIKQNLRNGQIHDIELKPIGEQLEGSSVPVNLRELLLKALWS